MIIFGKRFWNFSFGFKGDANWIRWSLFFLFFCIYENSSGASKKPSQRAEGGPSYCYQISKLTSAEPGPSSQQYLDAVRNKIKLASEARVGEKWDGSVLGMARVLQKFYGGENATKYILSAMISGYPALVGGMGGGGKTGLVEILYDQTIQSIQRNPRLREKYLADARKFSLQLNEHMNQADLLGAPNPFSTLKESDFTRIIEGSIVDPRVVLVQLEDIHNAPLPVFRALLEFLNEKRISDGNIVHQSFAMAVVITMNEYLHQLMKKAAPGEEKNIMALIDRLTVKFMMRNAEATEDDHIEYKRVLRGQTPSGQPLAPISQKWIMDLPALISLIERVRIDDAILDSVVRIAEGMDSYYNQKYIVAIEAALKARNSKGEGAAPKYFPPFQGSMRSHSRVIPLLKAAYLVQQLLDGVPYNELSFKMSSKDLPNLAVSLLQGGQDVLTKESILARQEALKSQQQADWSVNHPDVQDSFRNIVEDHKRLGDLIREELVALESKSRVKSGARENITAQEIEREKVRLENAEKGRQYIDELLVHNSPIHINLAALFSLGFAYRDLNHVFISSETDIKAILTAILGGVPLYIDGGPGSAKTMKAEFALKMALSSLTEDQIWTINTVFENLIKEAHVKARSIYSIQLSSSTSPGEITGRVDIAEMAKGKGLRRKTEGTAAAQDVMFALLDEWQRAPEAVKSSAFSLLNEKKFWLGLDVVTSNIVSTIVTSNANFAELLLSSEKPYTAQFPGIDRFLINAYALNKRPNEDLRRFYARINAGIKPSIWIDSTDADGRPIKKLIMPFMYHPLAAMASRIRFSEGSQHVDNLMQEWLDRVTWRIKTSLAAKNMPSLVEYFDNPGAQPHPPEIVTNSNRTWAAIDPGAPTKGIPSLIQSSILIGRVIDAMNLEQRLGSSSGEKEGRDVYAVSDESGPFSKTILELAQQSLQPSGAIPIRISDMAHILTTLVKRNPFYEFEMQTSPDGRLRLAVKENPKFVSPEFVARLSWYEKGERENFKKSHVLAVEIANKALEEFYDAQAEIVLANPELFPSLFASLENRIRWLWEHFPDRRAEIEENYREAGEYIQKLKSGSGAI